LRTVARLGKRSQLLLPIIPLNHTHTPPLLPLPPLPIRFACTHINPHTILPQNLSLLLPHQPHWPSHKRGQQIRNIERIDDGRQRACRGPVPLIRCGCESHTDEDREEGHFACENEFGERGVDVVVGHVFGGCEDVLTTEDGDYELSHNNQNSE
jgi:hypothetical protein